jgi:hypothetical protein
MHNRSSRPYSKRTWAKSPRAKMARLPTLVSTLRPGSRPRAARATTWRRIVDGSRLAGRFDLCVVVDDLSIVPFRVSGQELPHLLEALALVW